MTDSATEVRRRTTTVTIWACALVDGPGDLDTNGVDRVFTALSESKWQGESPSRFGFVDIHRLDGNVLYGFFAQEFERVLLDYDESKTEIRKDEEDFAKYLFILDLENERLLVHRRNRLYPTVPEWPTIFARMQEQLRYLFVTAQVTPPRQIVPLTVGETRQEFLRTFFDRSTVVKSVELEGFQLDLIPEDFPFFNPREELNEPFKEGIAETVHVTRRMSMVATSRGDLKRSPVARGMMQASANPRQMTVEIRETRRTRTLQAEKEVKTEVSITYDAPKVDEIGVILESLDRFSAQGRPPRRQVPPSGAVEPRDQPRLFDVGQGNAPAT